MYTMRAETRPEGNWAVESVQVSGCETPVSGWEASVNHVWNWVMGLLGSRSERRKPPRVSALRN